MRLQLNDIIFNNWKIKKVIGEGSFGVVYEIEREEFGHIYKAAAKVISIPKSQYDYMDVLDGDMSEENITAYYRSLVDDIIVECDLMERMKGDSHIVSYEYHHVVQEDDGMSWTIYIRMELLTPLINSIREKKLSEKDVVQLGIDLCRALETCQKFNVIHRDIKPENIFISNTQNYKLGDFGISKALERSEMAVSKKGTQLYMAPEVYRGEKYDATVDIYSLGLVLFRLTNNNRTPFLPDAPAPIYYQDKEMALQKRLSGIPIPQPCNAGETLSAIIQKACSFSPADRYHTPKEMRKDLEKILNDEEESVEKTLSGKTFFENIDIEPTGTLSVHNHVGKVSVKEEAIRRERAEEEKRKAEEEARRKAEEEARRKAEEEARRKAEEEARRKAEEEARRKAEEEARKKAEEEARRKAEEEARKKAEEEARRKAEEEARRKAEEEARRKAEEARRKVEEEARKKEEKEAFNDLEPFVQKNMWSDDKKKEQPQKTTNNVSTGRTYKVVAVILILLIAMGIAGINLTRMPDIYGLPIDEAYKKMEAAHLKFGIITEEASDKFPVAGYVVSQGKKAGAFLLKNKEVAVSFSTSVLLSQESAEEYLNSLNIPYTIEYEFTSDRDAGQLISCKIDYGKWMNYLEQDKKVVFNGEPENNGVILTVSMGPRVMQDVIGKTVDEADNILSKYGVNITTTEVFNSEVEAGRIVSQSVAAGELLEEGQQISIEVSKGVEKFFVPAVLNLSETEAVQALVEAGFKKKNITVTKEYNDTVSEGIVIAQEISEGTQVEKGSKIKITVSQGPKPVNNSQPKTSSGGGNKTKTQDDSGWNWEFID